MHTTLNTTKRMMSAQSHNYKDAKMSNQDVQSPIIVTESIFQGESPFRLI